MSVLAIDPGTESSGWVEYDGEILAHGNTGNSELLYSICNGPPAVHLAIEWMDHRAGQPVGATTFETCLWTGRIIQAFGGPFTLIQRHKVKHYLCNSTGVKDKHIRAALIHRFGGEQETKKGGRLHGIASHQWQALGVAVTWWHWLRTPQRAPGPCPICGPECKCS